MWENFPFIARLIVHKAAIMWWPTKIRKDGLRKQAAERRGRESHKVSSLTTLAPDGAEKSGEGQVSTSSRIMTLAQHKNGEELERRPATFHHPPQKRC
jgi:hypothetical protein